MQFDDLYNLVVESKGTKPGERFHRSSESEGPSGITSSPIGKSNYNPYDRDKENRKIASGNFKGERLEDIASYKKGEDGKYDVLPTLNPDAPITKPRTPSDKGMTDSVAVVKLLGKSFQLLKNDEIFADQMRGIMNGFKKNRHQISAYQESVIKTKPKTIDNLWGQINRLITIVNDPKKRQDKDIGKFEAELKEVKERKDEHQAELDKVFKEIENVAGDNEEVNDTYLQQLLVVIKDTAKRLYKKQSKELLDKGEPELSRVVPINELDFDMLEKNMTKNAETQLQLLEMLFSEDENRNPLLLFMQLQEERYEDSKQNFFNANRGDNYSISIEMLYKSLPLFSLVNYFSHIILKSPVIKLNTKQEKRVDALGSDGGMLDRLKHVKSEKGFEELRPELISYIKKQKIDKDTKKMLTNIANGPFQAVRGRANAAIKIMSSLKSANITESVDFDDFAASIMANISFDENDFRLDMMEIVETKNKK